jgi:uncharacterized repeat protein (TIGR03803 family)
MSPCSASYSSPYSSEIRLPFAATIRVVSRDYTPSNCVLISSVAVFHRYDMASILRVAMCVIVVGFASALASRAEAFTFKVIHSFCAENGCKDGALPDPSLAMDSFGNLYGATDLGGFRNRGVAFKLRADKKGGWRYQVFWRFCVIQRCSMNSQNTSSVIADSNGDVFGVHRVGQKRFEAFEISAEGIYSRLYRFKVGDFPNGPLTYAGAVQGLPYDGTSPLYGTLLHSVFSLTPSGNSWQQQTVYTFCSQPKCTDGDAALTSPIVGRAGDILGTTERGGGANGGGVIYRLLLLNGSWTETVLHEFCQVSGCVDGGSNVSAPAEDGAGNLFGTAGGGSYQQGVVYELSAQGNFAVLYNFCPNLFCHDGAAPNGVTPDSAGNLYGTATDGGGGYGVVFEITGQTETVLHTFCSEANCADGEVPVSQLLIDSHGNLFGTTRGGGANPSLEGVVFELSP